MISEVLNWIPENEGSLSTNWKGMESVQDTESTVKKAVKKFTSMQSYLDRAQRFLGKSYHGVVADLGSGTGILTAALACYKEISTIYSIEYSRNFVTSIMPGVFNQLNVDQSKIKRVMGDFNKLNIEDNTLDYVFELGAYHHSENIMQTVQETSRVLKRGGYFIGIDRVHPDSTSDDQIHELLYRQLSDNQKIRYGYKPGDCVTRKDWGEHEYRMREWRSFLEHAGLKVNILLSFQATGVRGTVKKWMIAPFEKKIIENQICWIPLPGINKMSSSLIIGEKI
jgi:ubiquinone/menaquinone biosynthesis C-methylase UbiE